MTQEELDALMSGDINDIEDDEISEQSVEENDDELVLQDEDEDELVMPYPATKENKMVHQLDDVTKESEEKATQMFDILEGVSTILMKKEENLNNLTEVLNTNIELFTKLSEKFPDIEKFQTSLAENEKAVEDANEVLEALQNSGDDIMSIMDIMQYQDIHRQKIERVINVMRVLSKYMNQLFEGKIEDSKRVSSAKHIEGDTHNELASTDDIEALLEQFGQK